MRRDFLSSEVNMDRIVISASLLALLEKADQPVDLCDEAGRVIGEFVPRFDPAEWEEIGPDDISDEELLARVRSNEPRYTTAEVLERLRKLP
jgi:hypothetical protein